MIRFIALAALVATVCASPPRPDGRLIGGEDASISKYPYQLSLQTTDVWGNNHICDATLISNKWAVTSVRCTTGMQPASLSVVAGITNLKDEGGQRVKVRRIHNHPDFGTDDNNHDVSCLELATKLTLNANVKPIVLPKDGTEPTKGTTVVITGWGATRIGGPHSDSLQRLHVPIVDRDTCRVAYGNQITKYMLCGGVSGGGRGTCSSDIGGAVVANGQLVGIVSWTYGCAAPGYPGVFSNVGALRRFIWLTTGI